MTYMVRIKEFHGTDAVYTYTFDNLNDALARVSRFLTPGNLFDERIEVNPTGFKETIRIETIQVWLGETNEEGADDREGSGLLEVQVQTWGIAFETRELPNAARELQVSRAACFISQA